MKEEASLDCPQAALRTARCSIPDTTVYQNGRRKKGGGGEGGWVGGR